MLLNNMVVLVGAITTVLTFVPNPYEDQIIKDMYTELQQS